MHAQHTKRCLLYVASRQLSGEACSAALFSSGLDRAVMHASCDRWSLPCAECSPPPHHISASASSTSHARFPSGWNALPESLPQRSHPTEGACRTREAAPAGAASGYSRGGVLGFGKRWSPARGGAGALGRGFAAEGSQSPAEKFDLIRQEAGAVRVEG